MNCAEAKQHIEALLDGELTGALKDAVENHLRACGPCGKAKDEGILLSSFLQNVEVMQPSADLEIRLLNAFREYHGPKAAWSWRKAIFGPMIIPRPVFAVFLVLVMGALWLAFNIGKINATAISISAPSVSNLVSPSPGPVESEIRKVLVEIPVIRERIVKRTLYIQDVRRNRNKEGKEDVATESNLPSSYSSVSESGYFTNVSLRGFRPPAEIGAQIIKEVKRNEK